jgi:hypothetical protein
VQIELTDLLLGDEPHIRAVGREDDLGDGAGGQVDGEDISGSTLRLVPGYTPAPNTTFDLIQNQFNDVTGRFAGLDVADGTIFTAAGQYFTINYHGGMFGHDVVLTSIAAPIASVQINDGNAQRSEVDSITVTYSTAMTFVGNPADAFKLLHVNNGNSVVLYAAVTTDGQGNTVVKLVFRGSETDPISGTGTANGGVHMYSLADGRYSLTSGTYTNPADTTGGNGLHLYRLFGDANGDGYVNQADLDLLSQAFNTHSGDTNYQWYLDANNDGWIFVFDLVQFGQRNGTNVFTP